MTAAKKLTPMKRRLLQRIAEHPTGLLEIQVTASGGSEPRKLRELVAEGYVERREHPTVKDRFWDHKATALYITPAGKEAMKKS